MSDIDLKLFLKWAGGKKRSAHRIVEKMQTEEFHRYFEPFIGGGSIFLSLKPDKAIISDYNSELVNTYKVIQEIPEKLIEYIEKKMKPNHSEDYYYKVREWDRKESFCNLSKVKKAARFIYLNKTCFNGIYRVNRKNQFNVPFGKYVNAPRIIDSKNIRKINEYMNKPEIIIKQQDYKSIENEVDKGDLVYLDPPYDVDKNFSEFTGYTQNGFDREEHKKMKRLCDKLIQKGAIVYISNSNTEFINELYSLNGNSEWYKKVDTISINRTIGSTRKSRRKFEEVLIRGKRG